ncbi:MAG TPA: PilZ domain-containing protein [Steroidobacteraceae bacterium]|nr:PilZ domain-containing protein [Steroidobacteraceae bacterium]
MRAINTEDQKLLVVGRPVPFAIYSADKTLLLAAGRIVPNEFVRDSLLRSGKYRDDQDSPAEVVDAPHPRASNAIAALQADYQHTHARATVGFRMEKDGRALTSRVIGVSDDGHGLIMTGPTLDGVKVEIKRGDSWLFRAFYAVAAVRFQATVEEVVTSPFSYFYVSHITDIDRRNVRQWPRTPTCLWASRAAEPTRLLVDLSVGGARLAVENGTNLRIGQTLLLSTTLALATGRRELSLDAVALNRYGHSDEKHPTIEFYGIQWDNLGDAQKLTLHAFVQEQLCMDLDRVWHVLTLAR